MYARVVIYTHDDDKDELEAKARAGVIPIVTNTPGYISYGVMFHGRHRRLRSASGSPRSTPRRPTKRSASG